MDTRLVTMKGVYIHYWTSRSPARIFASVDNSDPQDNFKSRLNPSNELINEILQKIAENCISKKPIQLSIDNKNFIVSSNETVVAGNSATNLPNASNEVPKKAANATKVATTEAVSAKTTAPNKPARSKVTSSDKKEVTVKDDVAKTTSPRRKRRS